MAIIREEKITIPYLKEKATHKTFDNGYQFIYVPKRGGVFNVSTWVKTGSINENDKNNGVSHFLEHLMFKGTERFAPGEFDRAMESMGAVINAATWKDFTFYYVTGPKGLKNKNFEKALDMHSDMLLFSILPENEIGEVHDPYDPNCTAIKRERGVVIEEIGMREDQPWTKIYNALNHMMYPDEHPYQRDVIGTRRIIGTIPRDNILDYYHKWYSAGNMTTIVVGDFDEEWLKEKVVKYFDFSKRKTENINLKAVVNSVNLQTNGKRFIEIEGDFNTSFFIIGFHGPKPEDLKETIAVDVASKVLGEGRSSRLYQAFIERPSEPVFNTISCGQSTFKLGNVFYVQGNLNAARIEAHLDNVQDEIRKYLTNDYISNDEFQRTLKKLKVNFAETSETASGISESIGESLTVTGKLDEYIYYLDILEHLTIDDVIEAAKRWFNPDKAYITTLIPKGEI